MTNDQTGLVIEENFNQISAVVTGGGGALCSEIALSLASAGASVAVLDLDQAAAQEVANRILNKNGRAIAVQCDVTNSDSIANASEVVSSNFESIDVLINGAGGNHPGATTSEEQSFFHLIPDSVRKVFDLNFLGTFLTCQAFGKDMVDQSAGT